MMKCEWILCPVLWEQNPKENLGRTIVWNNYPLYCPKCRQERLIKVDNLKITVIKEPDAIRRAMELWNNSRIIGSFLFVFERIVYQIKKTILWGYFVIPEINL